VPERGWAVDREEGNIGVSCVAAPIFGPLGDIAAALSVTGPSQLVRADRMGPAVRMAAAAASRAYTSRPRSPVSSSWATSRSSRGMSDERSGASDMRSR
jgi:transcriptional regulator of acetoin/glycerol metabolism